VPVRLVTWLWLGASTAFEGDYKRSADMLRQALAIDRGSYQVWGNLAGALKSLGIAPERRPRIVKRKAVSSIASLSMRVTQVCTRPWRTVTPRWVIWHRHEQSSRRHWT
jgi:hypothetical protein